MKKRKLETSPNVWSFEFWDAGSLIRVHTNSLPDQKGLDVVGIFKISLITVSHM